MLNSELSTVAVIGATGQQGSAVVDSLLAAGHPVRAVLRDVHSEKARALTARGVSVVYGDQDKPDSLADALLDIRSLFLMTTYSEANGGPEGEVRRGRAVAESAARAKVPHVVYSAVGGAERKSGVPHVDSKRSIEIILTKLLPSSFIRPTFFMENLSRGLGATDSADFVLRLPMPGDVPIEMVAVVDIGKVAAAVLLDPAALPSATVEIAGDTQTGNEIAALIGTRLG